MYEIIIIGSGAAGLAAAIYANRAGKKTIVIEKDYEGAGQITLGGTVDNYPGFIGITGMKLGEKLREHAKSLGANIVNETVLSITKTGDEFVVKTDKGEIRGMNVIYATGASHRKLGVKGEEELAGMGVSYCATCDGALYKGADVIVAGGGNTAVDDALYLSEIAGSVTLVHRRDQFRADKASLEKLKNKENVRIITGVTITEILGEDEVTGVKLNTGEELDAEGIFIAVGMRPETGLLEAFEIFDENGNLTAKEKPDENGNIKNLDLLDDSGYVKASEDGRTLVKGLYVAGDVRTKSLRQVVTAVADGANCVNSIIQDSEG